MPLVEAAVTRRDVLTRIADEAVEHEYLLREVASISLARNQAAPEEGRAVAVVHVAGDGRAVEVEGDGPPLIVHLLVHEDRGAVRRDTHRRLRHCGGDERDDEHHTSEPT